MDFSLILVLATLATGLVWGAHRAYRAMGCPASTAEPVVVEYARSFFPVLLLVLVVRSFLFEPFRIPSSSMMPTLLTGDFIFVNKYTYGLRLPVLNTKIVDIGEPRRGDVIVFRLPADPSTNYIKRLVGLPGDTIRYANDHLVINGQPVPDELRGIYNDELQPGSILLQEQLGSVSHQILLIPGGAGRGDGTFVVPPGHYFMMGDNRDNSQDSRFIGPIPEANIVGRAVRIWMNWDFRSMPRWGRIGGRIE
ncbi:MAG: signal peptidase I [Gammaproteobacteria bacterium]